MAQGKEQRSAAARRAAADDCRKGAELAEQFMNVVGPDLVLRLVAIDDYVGGAAVAPVEDDHAVAKLGELAGLVLYAAEIAASARRQGDPWPGGAENLIVNINAANFCVRHRAPPSFDLPTLSDEQVFKQLVKRRC
jgi:hypothetical protein